MPQDRDDSLLEKTANAVRNTAQATTDYVQNAVESATEAAGNLFGRNSNEESERNQTSDSNE